MRINILAVADDARYGKLPIVVLTLCAALMAIDRYDFTSIGAALPPTISQMKINPGSAGLPGVSALVGMTRRALADSCPTCRGASLLTGASP
ncbi:hypothetical protein GCM10019059_21990 [Camelimonas fluminis]|uniref:MFS transporter n=1 Tax=Camelimonas fluminis TaxID=1576911 RepID=A0ABV7UFW7_9HYPH|nr:hypothetical protein [Camelimonas fluminis]GHE62107.1 hypothetical protein GCM10019059_21990 [Camelimonas fluminis]